MSQVNTISIKQQCINNISATAKKLNKLKKNAIPIKEKLSANSRKSLSEKATTVLTTVAPQINIKDPTTLLSSYDVAFHFEDVSTTLSSNSDFIMLSNSEKKLVENQVAMNSLPIHLFSNLEPHISLDNVQVQLKSSADKILLASSADIIITASKNIGYGEVKAVNEYNHISIVSKNSKGQTIKSTIISKKEGLELKRDAFGFVGKSCDEALKNMDKELSKLGWDVSLESKNYKDEAFVKQPQKQTGVVSKKTTKRKSIRSKKISIKN